MVLYDHLNRVGFVKVCSDGMVQYGKFAKPNKPVMKKLNDIYDIRKLSGFCKMLSQSRYFNLPKIYKQKRNDENQLNLDLLLKFTQSFF